MPDIAGRPNLDPKRAFGLAARSGWDRVIWPLDELVKRLIQSQRAASVL
jgi:hypothetical protein